MRSKRCSEEPPAEIPPCEERDDCEDAGERVGKDVDVSGAHVVVMGIVGGIVIMRWSIDLCRRASRQLLDLVPSRDVANRIREQLEAIDDVRVADLHVWELGPKRQSCVVSLVTSTPRDTEHHRSIILENAASRCDSDP